MATNDDLILTRLSKPVSQQCKINGICYKNTFIQYKWHILYC